jgi:hypothetical protein
MSEIKPPSDDGTSPSALERIVAVCDRYEAAWRVGLTPRIEDHLEDVPEPQRPALLRELLALELELRQARGERPDPEEYRHRFAEQAALIDGVFCTGPSPAGTTGPISTIDYPDSSTTPARRAALAGQVPVSVPGYRIIQRLGQGGMGTVFEAQESATGRRVALKFITPHAATSPRAADRFRREGRIASAIDHPRCVFVLKADFADELPYIIMELMSGETLQQYVGRQKGVPPDEAVSMILDVIEGLQEAHRLGVIHRDIKPSNCFLGADGRVKLGDFGLAKILSETSDLSASGQFLGTPSYSSPEQIKGLPLDPRTDLYSTAATLYALLAGQPPFRGQDAAATLAMVVSEDPPPIRASRPEVPEPLERVVLRGMHRDRERRWADLEEFREALLPFAPGRITPGTLGLRLVASIIDTMVISLPFGALGVSGYYLFDAVNSYLYAATSNFAGFAYYATSEGLLGWSPGKRLMRLRVWPARGIGPAGIARCGLRYAVLIAGSIAGVILGARGILPELPDDPRPFAANDALRLLPLGWFAVNWAWIRPRNGYRGLHEWLSGTRVVRLPPKSRDAQWPRGDARLMPRPDDDSERPDLFGPYRVRQRIRRDEGVRIFLADDPDLGRRVWVVSRPTGEVPPWARRDLTRLARQRWLDGGDGPAGRWDAYVAPLGVPLPDLIADEAGLPWREALPILHQVASELATAEAEGTSPQLASEGQVLIAPNGRVMITDYPPGPWPSEEAGPLDFLARVGRRATGRNPGVQPRPPGGPVPLRAGRFLDRLLGAAEPFPDVAHAATELHALRAAPTEVGRPQRCVRLAIVAILCFPWFLMMVSMKPSWLSGEELYALQTLRDGHVVRQMHDKLRPVLEPGQPYHSGDLELARRSVNLEVVRRGIAWWHSGAILLETVLVLVSQVWRRIGSEPAGEIPSGGSMVKQ